jgi:hypothetical protein
MLELPRVPQLCHRSEISCWASFPPVEQLCYLEYYPFWSGNERKLMNEINQRDIEEFEQQRKVHTEDWLQSLRKAKRCDWCGWEDGLNRRGLCASCERIRKRLSQACKQDTSDQRVQIRIRRAKSEKQNAINHGVQIKALLHDTSGLNLEHLLTTLGERMTGENLFHGYSHEISWAFDATQRTILAALFWMILSRQAQKNRRYFAAQDTLYSAMMRSR